MPEVTLFTLQYPWGAAATMLEAWQEWITTTPDEVWSNCQILSQGTYGFLGEIGGVFCGSPVGARVVPRSLEVSYRHRSHLQLQRVQRVHHGDGD
jgi:hypothetical protein